MAVAAAVSGRRQRSGSGSGGLAGLPQPSRRTWVQPRSLLLHLAILAAASLGSALLASSPGRSRSSAVVPAAAATSGIAPGAPAPAGGAVRLAVVAPLQQASPFSGASWREVLEHTGQRLAWTDAAFQLVLHDASSELDDPAAAAALAADLKRCQAAVAIGVTDATEAATLAPLLAGAPTALALGSAPALAGATRLGGRVPGQPGGLPDLLASLLPGAKQAKLDAQVLQSVGELYGRGSSDDFMFIFLVLANAYIKEVPAVSMTFKQKNAGLGALSCMVGKCGGQIYRCVSDTQCKAALDCLQACEFNDQVCTYRCITSYESRELEEFSLCIIQKHNCFGLTAEIPTHPDPLPMSSFRGQPLTHELAEDLLIGWLQDPSTSLGELRGGQQDLFSWRVFAGKNAAYDYFPNQYQLFYRGKGKGGMWYDPAFQVQTVDGRLVWRRRHYRVKRGASPGTFRFSVLDNGVTSNEFWRVLDCDEALEWCVFYYSGAASRAGLNYSGAILASRDGAWPTSQEARRRIEASLEVAGIKMWELSNVDNSLPPAEAPLDPALMAMA